MTFTTLARFCAGFFLCVFLGACATPQLDRLSSSKPVFEPRRIQLEVPFVAQTDDTCGPAALAMLLQQRGQYYDLQQLELQSVLPQRGGALQVEMLAMTRRQGLLAYPLTPQLDALLTEVGQGRPVIVLVNLSFNWWPRWHYMVVTGFDLDKNTITVHSGKMANQTWSLFTFEHLWTRSNYWSFVALGPNEWPTAVDEVQYLKAVIDLERSTNLAKSAWAYRQALTRWPGNLSALVGAGNAAYEGGDKTQALSNYRQAVEQHPRSATAANNLAQTLLDLGNTSEAKVWAQKAVELGGGPAAQETLISIHKKETVVPVD